jgi:hypothetical protein
MKPKEKAKPVKVENGEEEIKPVVVLSA